MKNTLIDFNQKVFDTLLRPVKGEQAIEYRWIKNTRLRALVTHRQIRWIVRMSWKGKRYYESFGTYPEMKLAQFNQLAYQYIADVQSGAYQKGSRLTMQQFFDEDMVPYSRKHHRDQKNVMSRSKLVMKLLGRKRVAEVSRRDVQTFLTSSLEGRSNSTINRYQAFLSKLFSMAVDFEIISQNPCKGIKKLPENNIRERILSLAEVEAFHRIALLESNIFQARALLLSLMTGMRIGNVISLKYSMIASDLSSLTLPMTKSGKSQSIYLNAPAQQIIRQSSDLASSQFVFPSLVKKGQHLGSPRTCLVRIQTTMQKEGCFEGHFTIHDLRRTFSSYMLLATGDIRLAQQALGHSSLAVTTRYAHHQSPQLASASDKTVEVMFSNLLPHKT